MVTMGDPGKPPRPPPRRTAEVEPDTDLHALPGERAKRPTTPPSLPPPPPPPRQRTRSVPPPPPPAPPARRVPSQPSQVVKPTVDIWQIEIEVLKREAQVLAERDQPRAALLQGAIAQLASSLLGDGPAGAAALQLAAALSSDRFIPMFSRREAIGAR